MRIWGERVSRQGWGQRRLPFPLWGQIRDGQRDGPVGVSFCCRRMQRNLRLMSPSRDSGELTEMMVGNGFNRTPNDHSDQIKNRAPKAATQGSLLLVCDVDRKDGLYMMFDWRRDDATVPCRQNPTKGGGGGDARAGEEKKKEARAEGGHERRLI